MGSFIKNFGHPKAGGKVISKTTKRGKHGTAVTTTKRSATVEKKPVARKVKGGVKVSSQWVVTPGKTTKTTGLIYNKFRGGTK